MEERSVYKGAVDGEVILVTLGRGVRLNLKNGKKLHVAGRRVELAGELGLRQEKRQVRAQLLVLKSSKVLSRNLKSGGYDL